MPLIAHEPVQVRKTALPPLSEYAEYLQGIWQRAHLTNNGPLVQELETALAAHLGVANVVLVANATLALVLLLKAMQVKGSVITTPFSYVATASSIVWSGLRPVFADIETERMGLNPDLVEAVWQADTGAILATHVYGIPVKREPIERLARERGVPVIYDAAHCFNCWYENGESLLEAGDASVVSFHATKLFNTAEGGAIITRNTQLAEQLRGLRAFGEATAVLPLPGINAKLSELHAALGLCNLRYVDDWMEASLHRVSDYDEQLPFCDALQQVSFPEEVNRNGCYYPVVFATEALLLKAVAALEEKRIFPRRYFYPSLNRMPGFPDAACPVAESLASRILCLPIYPELEPAIIAQIARVLRHVLA